IVSLHAGEKNIKEATCGGLVGVGTLLDPAYSKADGLNGNIAGRAGLLPPTLSELTLETHILERVVGTKELLKVERINPSELLLLHVGAAVDLGKVISIKKDVVKVKLSRPICAQRKSRVSISRKITARWRLIGYGIMLNEQ
ncbi:MAG: translation initiation factor IF-2 subunit gamma, partial [Candidatus Bathyarchaeia archaeon]